MARPDRDLGPNSHMYIYIYIHMAVTTTDSITTLRVQQQWSHCKLMYRVLNKNERV